MRNLVRDMRVVEWLRLTDAGLRALLPSDLARQKRDVLAHACASLGVDTDGTRAVLLARLRAHEFTDAQLAEKGRLRAHLRQSA